MNRLLDVVNKPVYALTSDGPQPRARGPLETLLATVATVAMTVTALVMAVGIGMLVIEPWSTPEPPVSLALVMTGLPCTTLAIAYAAAFASRQARGKQSA